MARITGIWALVALALATGCKDEDEVRPAAGALPLDVPLAAGQTRAGVITQPGELLTGVTAKGRLGDFKLYNSRIAVIIGRAGFARGYQQYGGTIVDADRVRAPGEQGHSTFGEIVTAFDLSIVSPDSIEVVADGRDGGASIVRVRGRLADFPLLKTLLSEIVTREEKPVGIDVDYIMEPDADALKIAFTLHNAGDLDAEIALPLVGFLFGDGAQPFVPGFGFASPEPGARTEYYAAVSPDVSYLYGRDDTRISFILSISGLVLGSLGDSFTLRAREKKTVVHHLVIGDGDLSASQALWRKTTGREGVPRISGRVLDAAGAPVAGARVHLVQAQPANPVRDYTTLTRTAADGTFVLEAAAGDYALTVATDAQVLSEPQPLTLGPGGLPALDVRLPGAGTLTYRVTGPGGGLLPAKLTLVSEGGARGLLPDRYGEALRPSGTLRAEYGVNGQGSVELPAGTYRVYVSRGSEYEMAEQQVTVESGREARVEASLERTVSTPGWMSTDTHVHAQLSPDSPDLYPFKVSTMVVEGLELPISTEHEAIGDFNPAIRELGLEAWIKGIIGSEVTTFVYGHFNAFPLAQDFDKPGNGRIDWIDKKPGQTFAAIRENAAAPFLQVNHPRSDSIGGYFTAMGLDRDTLQASRADQWSNDFDGIEVANGCGVQGIESSELLDWFSFLNKGQRKVALGSTDNHKAGRGGMGYPKTFVRMPTDDPRAASEADFRRAMFEGRAIVTCGPFLELKLGTAEIGDTVEVTGDLIRLDARAAAPSWMDLDQLEVIVDGALVKTVPITTSGPGDRFAGTITASITPGQDGWVILRARGDRRHGIWAGRELSWAFTNPIFLDGDRDGEWTMQ